MGEGLLIDELVGIWDMKTPKGKFYLNPKGKEYFDRRIKLAVNNIDMINTHRKGKDLTEKEKDEIQYLVDKRMKRVAALNDKIRECIDRIQRSKKRQSQRTLS